MSKWRSMHDSEINYQIVRNLLGYGGLTDNDIRRAYIKGSFDYCNDWSYAGPLMSDNEIEFDARGYHLVGKFRASPDMHLFDEMGEGFAVEHNNPCRAIAECYLMMKDEDY